MNNTENTKCGYVAVIGKPNAGKSTLINAILGEDIALVSHKANATRKRSQIIVMHNDGQIVFVDTPGLHEKERELNKFMLNEAIKALGDADVIVFIADIKDSVSDYEKFLDLNSKNIPHILVLNKIDRISNEDILKNISKYQKYQDKYQALIPLSALKKRSLTNLLDELYKAIPYSPYLFDPEQITSDSIRDVYKEIIREAVFNGLSDEIPYEADVIIESIEEFPTKDNIKAVICIEKQSQKGMVIGKNGETIKRLGIASRKKLEHFSGKKIRLDLFVKISPNWSKNKNHLDQFGYKYDN